MGDGSVGRIRKHLDQTLPVLDGLRAIDASEPGLDLSDVIQRLEQTFGDLNLALIACEMDEDD